MRLLACLLVLSGLVDASHLPSLQSQFSHFSNKYGKEYEGEEVFTRFNNFKDNLEAIQKLSKLNSHRSFRVGINSLADLSFDEYRARYLSPVQVEVARKQHPHKAAHHHAAPHHSHSLPTSFDWRSKGVVSPVKDQADCGGAGAIVGLETLESAWGIKHSFVELSQEEIIDCASSTACSNLDLKTVYTFAEKNGVCDSSSYPPSSSNSTTCSSSSCTPASKFMSHTSISPSTSDSFLAAVAQQPVAAAIEADSMVFQLYTGGILDSPVCGTTLNHVVLIVGWGSENGTDYWIAQNSWGTNWGENGSVRIARGKNVCGIESQGMYPISA